MTMLAERIDFVIGVDTHKHTHSAAVIDSASSVSVDELAQPSDPDGYRALLAMADRHPGSRAWAIEGTGGYGAGLARFLSDLGEEVIELDRPNRPARRNGAKTDALDAARAGREALARAHLAQPRERGRRTALSNLLAARRSAVESASVALCQLQSLVVAAPEELRSRFRGQSARVSVTTAAGLRINPRWDLETHTAAITLRCLARRVRALETEAADHRQSLLAIITDWRPDLLDQPGIGPISAAVILCAWSHPGRFRSDGAFANLAGAAPIPASSGLTNRHRLNPYGDRQLNRALHVITIVRLRYDPSTQAYTARRRAEGKTDREIKRCLKRYIARQIFKQLENPHP